MICGICKSSDVSVAHVRTCSARHYGAPPPAATTSTVKLAPAPRPTLAEGYWTISDGRVFKIQAALNGSGRLYAKELDEETGKFVYAPDLFSIVRSNNPQRLTKERAAAYGKLYGRCMICGRPLTDDDSIAAGIGPICAVKQGW